MNKPKRVCARPGCRGVVTGDVCSRCGPRRPRPDRRPSAAARGYNRAWQRRAAQYLAAHPLCQVCELRGMIRGARIVHHVDRVSEGHDVLAEDARLVGVCSQLCHDLIEPFGHNWRLAMRAIPPIGEGGSF